MRAYLVRRLAYAVLTFLGITVATFTLIHSVPGDPTRLHFSTRSMSPEVREAIRREYRLDRPLPEQYFHWLRGVVTFDYGRSITDRRPVMDRIIDKLPNTLLLALTAMVLSTLIGIPLGVWSATHAGQTKERVSAVLLFLLYSLPSFWVALLLMQFFAVKLEILPVYGIVSDNYRDLDTAGKLFDRMQHLVLPTLTLAYMQMAMFARVTKAALTETVRQDYITTARAKGAPHAVVLWRHAFRNALMPLITLLGLLVPLVLSGSVIVEQIFEWDGLGRLYFDAILQRDYPTVMGMTVVTAIVTLVASIIADILYALADPRVRLGEARQ